MNDKPKPAHTIRLGAIQAAIWANEGQHGPFFGVTIEKRFRDAEGQWQGSGSFNRDDLLVLAKVADCAHTYICERQSAERVSQPEAAPAETPAVTGAVAENGKRRGR